MASLTETAVAVRMMIKIAVLALILFIIGFYSYRIALNLFFTHQQPPPTPTLRFGPLPPPIFPKSVARITNFTLENTTGQFPYLGNMATVSAFETQQKFTFATRNEMIAKARSIGFTQPPSSQDQSVLHFTDDQYPTRTLTVQVTQDHFIYQYNYAQDPASLAVTTTFDDNTMISQANNFLSRWESLPTDLANGLQTVTYLQFDSAQNKLIPADAKADAVAARVDFFRADQFVGDQYGPHPVVTEGGTTSSTYVIIGQSPDPKKQILEAVYNYTPLKDVVDPHDGRDPNATYPIKSSQQAFQELQSGYGYIAEGTDTDTQAVNEINLAYYEANTNPQYLYPVYLFKSDGFMAYVSAITADQFAVPTPTPSSSATQPAVQGISTQRVFVPNQVSSPFPQTGSGSPARPLKFSDLLR